MAARDKYHLEFREALEKDGWTITHDPYFLETEETEYEVDIGAEKVIGAEKGGVKIAVEIKSFLRESVAYDFHEALGQYLQYRLGMQMQEPDRAVFLAVTANRYKRIIQLTLPRLSIQQFGVQVVVFDPDDKKITQWIPR